MSSLDVDFFDDEFGEQAAQVSKAPAALRVVSTFFKRISSIFRSFYRNKPLFFYKKFTKVN